MKFDEDGDLLILREIAAWEDIEPRLMENIGLVCIFCAAIAFNFVLLLMSFSKSNYCRDDST
jgi:hypothetical protein